jgi:hypothetical protein
VEHDDGVGAAADGRRREKALLLSAATVVGLLLAAVSFGRSTPESAAVAAVGGAFVGTSAAGLFTTLSGRAHVAIALVAAATVGTAVYALTA